MSYRKDKPETIQSMFNSIADRYDLTNQVLSFGLNNRWNHRLVKEVALYNHHKPVYLDLCSGTGDIAFNYLKTANHPSCVYMLDFSSLMLEKAKEKAEKKSNAFESHTLHFVEADAQSIPLPDASVDFITIAYGIRNVQNPDQCFKEVHRVLKPGGTFGILELTRPTTKWMRLGHKLYLKTFLPLVGKLLTRNEEAYRYLCQSIDHFISPLEIEKKLMQRGFSHVKKLPLSGGIATIITGHKQKN